MPTLSNVAQAYFTDDGLYGDRNDMPSDLHNWIIIPTDHWSDAMWQVIDSVANDERADMACHMQSGHDLRRGLHGTCYLCNLTAEELGIKSLTLADIQEIEEEEYYNA
jgi:hypothetical protein